MTKEEVRKNKRVRTFWLAVLAGILLAVANVSGWLNRQVFDSQNFTSTATVALTSESSRQAIAQNVTDRAFANRPILKNVAGDVSIKIISGLLDTTQANNAVAAVVSKLHAAVTTSHPQDIAIDLSGLKSVLVSLYGIATDLGREPQIDPGNIPNQLVLVQKNQIPNFYLISLITLWVGPLAFIGALAALLYPYFREKWDYKATLVIQGICVAAALALDLLMGPLLKPLLLGNVPTQSGQQVIGNVLNDFVAKLNHQTAWLIALALIALIVGALLQIIPRLQEKRRERG